MSAPYFFRMNWDGVSEWTGWQPSPTLQKTLYLNFPPCAKIRLEGVKPPTSTQPKPVIALYLLWLRALICQRFWGTYNKIRLTQGQPDFFYSISRRSNLAQPTGLIDLPTAR